MEILEANIRDVNDLTRVEIQSKTKSAPKGPEPIEAFSPLEVDFPARLQRWSSYLSGKSSPQGALAERVVFKACVDGKMIGYIAGHLTTRYGKDAEIQSFYILKENQRAGVGGKLLLRLIEWATRHKARSLCVGIAPENRYKSFYLKYGGRHLSPHWIYWDDMEALAKRIEQSQKTWIM